MNTIQALQDYKNSVLEYIGSVTDKWNGYLVNTHLADDGEIIRFTIHKFPSIFLFDFIQINDENYTFTQNNIGYNINIKNLQKYYEAKQINEEFQYQVLLNEYELLGTELLIFLYETIGYDILNWHGFVVDDSTFYRNYYKQYQQYKREN